jgi:hypothetical protein
MSSESPKKGKHFEEQVGAVLETLRARHPDVVKVAKQPRFTLHDGQDITPDFHLQYELPHEVGHYLIECQDRKRSKSDIAQKIRYIKALSSRNRFIFVFSSNLPEATRRALDADGVLVTSLDEFSAFLARLEITLSAVKAAEGTSAISTLLESSLEKLCEPNMHRILREPTLEELYKLDMKLETYTKPSS